PMSNLKWSNKSTYSIANELRLRGHKISEDTVGRLLKQEGYWIRVFMNSEAFLILVSIIIGGLKSLKENMVYFLMAQYQQRSSLS
ncbi:hypothetical protein C5S32_00520, partial [ANME-1 cluster archaeon GoMg1]|nr:hypothetical protein [ANME-1 cluster archaeon GoMg1]